MTMARLARDILKDAIRLPQPERVRVLEELLATLDAKSDREVDAAWASEVAARSRELKQGLVRPIPWATVRARARKRARGQS